MVTVTWTICPLKTAIGEMLVPVSGERGSATFSRQLAGRIEEAQSCVCVTTLLIEPSCEAVAFPLSTSCVPLLAVPTIRFLNKELLAANVELASMM